MACVRRAVTMVPCVRCGPIMARPGTGRIRPLLLDWTSGPGDSSDAPGARSDAWPPTGTVPADYEVARMPRQAPRSPAELDVENARLREELAQARRDLDAA